MANEQFNQHNFNKVVLEACRKCMDILLQHAGHIDNLRAAAFLSAAEHESSSALLSPDMDAASAEVAELKRLFDASDEL